MSDINMQQVRKPFSYEIIRESTIKQNEYSSAIAISKDNLLVLATADKAIKVYQLKLGKLKQFQHLNMFRKDGTAISLFEKSSLFITGAIDSTIRISSTTLFSSAKYIQQLYGHTSWISNLIIHPVDQDVLFSSSNDSQIRVWQNMQSWCCCQIIKEHKNDVKGLSISKTGNQLLSCSEDLQILIMEPVSNKNYFPWQVVQKIKVDQQGYRICSIDDSIFTFQQDSQNHMHIYSKDENGLYCKTG
ncbi:unnamed protein product (macronuclear) [Paramecium tetraurelia]|uniref:Uncharacterized protein n=1 Tax=Paramecium tetraurelia TaxID=5888 RepID=A0BDC7_PARTE|nr:uncharacterized protein GSPATT00027572001 [Paramecium tetraurelia]CAK56544.1 unnamed protein product [Paramecium tetraurelia]|eukprot:XP_001423942.1 hypothetical protein (macronuclear) [Paramecium tetraurelia strain d4-2]